MARLMEIEKSPMRNDPRDLCLVKFGISAVPPNFVGVMFNSPITKIPTDLPDHPNLSKPVKIFNKSETIDIIWTYVKETKGSLINELNKWRGVTGVELTKFHYVLRKIFKSAATGLAALHEAGYAHRNLLKEFILIKGRNNAKVMGYSLKKDKDQMKSEKFEMENFCPFYRPPRKQRERHDHFKDDVYALGRILMESVCNEGPLQIPAENILELIPNKLSGSIVDLLTKMLALNQNERITMTEVAQHEWFNEDYGALTDQKADSGLRLITNEKSGLFKPYSDKMREKLKAEGVKVLNHISGGAYANVSKVKLTGRLLEKNGGVEIAAMKIAELKKYRGEMELRETELTLHLNHPNIIKCLDLFKDGGRYLFIVMELAKCALSDICKRHWRVTKEKAPGVAKIMKPYLHGMCKGITFLHHSEWVHRDIKPANVLIKMDDVAAVCDFSFSRPMPKGELSKTWSCTLDYASPQLLRKEDGYNPYANDIWGCGVTIFECLTGTKLTPQVKREQMEAEFRKIPSKLTNSEILSPHAIELLMALLRFDEDERPDMEVVVNSKFFNETTQPLVPSVAAQPQPGPSRAPDYPIEPRPGPSRALSGSEPEGRAHKRFMKGN